MQNAASGKVKLQDLQRKRDIEHISTTARICTSITAVNMVSAVLEMSVCEPKPFFQNGYSINLEQKCTLLPQKVEAEATLMYENESRDAIRANRLKNHNRPLQPSFQPTAREEGCEGSGPAHSGAVAGMD
ncbi:hypothetical protein DNTS_017987 [Danionella cerebrum]|uniref:Uncharacterized protein n=1 Tax=Danionella cerebrum TaxID=2873325 RepID=A0A553REA3_9TELE|nr:hypothetical protein DNTS_017987 [Danionella translucida]